MTSRGLLLTGIAMVAFAGNSVLCRAALADGEIDWAAFTGLRLLFGALMLLLWIRPPSSSASPPSWQSAVALIVYAVFFSGAYVHVDTGTGALLLFGAVQITMVAVAAFAGERPSFLGVAGMTVASAGLVLLCLGGVSAPPIGAASLMLLSGAGWGLYSHYGRGQPFPHYATAMNFLRSAPVGVLLLVGAGLTEDPPSLKGVTLAIISGAVTSGLGYVIWYAALKHHTSTSAAAVQLSAPLLAATGGVVMLGEPVTLRLIVGGALVVSGIALSFRRPTEGDTSSRATNRKSVLRRSVLRDRLQGEGRAGGLLLL